MMGHTVRSRRRSAARTAVLAFAVSLAVTSLAGARVETPGVHVPGGYQVASRVQLAEDVFRYTMVASRTPQRVTVVRAPAGGPLSLRVALARGRIAGPSPRTVETSRICRANRCAAAVNGSFFELDNKRPLGAVVADGEPVQSSTSPREQLLVARDGTLRTGRLQLPTTLTAHYPQKVTLGDLGIVVDAYDEPREIAVSGINVARRRGGIVLYTHRLGPATPRTSGVVELIARITDPGAPLRVDAPTTIEPHALRWGSGTRLRPDEVVLTGHGAGKDALVALWRDIRAGRARSDLSLMVATSVPTWDSVGGRPVLLRDGRIHDTRDGPGAQTRAPRTIVGWNAEGDLLFVTIDGRQARARGMTLREAARFMQVLGAVDAINLDGGGSTTYVERGRVRNVPSDVLVVREGRARIVHSPRRGDRIVGHVERPVATAVMLVAAS